MAAVVEEAEHSSTAAEEGEVRLKLTGTVELLSEDILAVQLVTGTFVVVPPIVVARAARRLCSDHTNRKAITLKW